ncbi:MAG: hypothetical protein QXO51_02330, partial [Halobacteria archaeon]
MSARRSLTDGTFPVLARLYGVQGLMAAGISFGWSLMWLYWWKQGLSLATMALFHGAFFGVAALATLLFRSVPMRAGMAVGLLLRGGSLLAAFFVATPLHLALLVVPLSIGLFLFWIPFNVAYFRRTSRDHLALTLGLFFAVFPVLNAVLPALAGGLAASAGFFPVFVLAALFMALGCIPIRGLERDRVPVDLKGALGHRARWLMLLEGGWQGVTFVAVPFFTLTFVDRPAEYGGVLSLFGLAGVAASLLLAWSSDRLHRRRGFLVPITAAMSATTLLAATSTTLLQWEVLNGIASFTAALAPAFMTAVVLESGRGVEVKRISRSLRSREIRQYPGLKAGASFQDGSQAGALRRKGSERR